MKQKYLSVLFCGMILQVSAQDITPGTTYWDQDYENSDYCIYQNSAMTGELYYGQNINNDISRENYLLVFSSPSLPLAQEGCPSWIGFTGYDNDHAICDLIKVKGGIDMSDNPYFSIKAKADEDGAKLTVYLGYVGSNSSADFYPVSSTRYTGSGTIKIELTLTTTLETYTFNFTNLSADETVWSAWTDRTQVNVYGVTPQSPDTKYYISRIQIGYPEPIVARESGIVSISRTSAIDPCKDVTAVHSSSDQELNIVTETGGHVQIDPSFMTDKVIVSDMLGKTEEFSGNEFYTQLKGVLMLNCISGNRAKKVKVFMN